MADSEMYDDVHASWCEIHLSRISKNLELALNLLPPMTTFCAVLKADAYGHGIAKVVPIIRGMGVKYVGITSNSEARAVRDAGFDGALLRLRSATQGEIRAAIKDQVQEHINSPAAARIVRTIVDEGQRTPGFHLALNAGGMSRDGLELSTDEGRTACLEILDLVGPHVVGICNHFPSNTEADIRVSNDRFQEDLAWIFSNSELRRSDVLVHAGSSLTLVSGQGVSTDMYRCGAILYGILAQDLGFQPTMELKSRITSVATYPKGSTIGYDRASSLDQDRRLASVSLGYANGFSRDMFGRSSILIHGKKAPVLGKISMNTLIADVTDLLDVAVGDEVVAFGQQGIASIDVATVEQQSNTIIAELYTDWGHRNPRVYHSGDAEMSAGTDLDTDANSLE